MPMLYGEGNKAFLRLQEEIIKNNADMSIFAWKTSPDTCQEYMGILAPSPREFKHASRMCPARSKMLLGELMTFSISNRGVEFNSPLPGDRITGCSILPLFHSDLPPNVPRSDFNIAEIRTSYGVYIRSIGTTYVRSQPYLFANVTFQPGITESMGPFQAAKWLSAKDSDAISRRELLFRKPADLKHPNFGLAIVEPDFAWNSSLRSVRALNANFSSAILKFKPIWTDEFPPFTLVCQYENPGGARFSLGFWKCDLVQGDDEWGIAGAHMYFSTHDGVSCQDNQPSLGTKILDLPHLRGDLRTKRVQLSLQRELKEENGHTQFFIDLRVSDKD